MRTLKYRIGQPYPTLPPKDPGGVLDYGFEWGATDDPWLQTGETITISNWSIEPNDATLVQDSKAIQETRTIVFLSGGTLNVTYQVTNTITTSEGRTAVRSVYLPIKEL